MPFIHSDIRQSVNPFQSTAIYSLMVCGLNKLFKDISPFLSEGENYSLNNWRKMSLLNNAILGNLTLAAGISATVQVVLIALMFAVTRYPYGII